MKAFCIELNKLELSFFTALCSSMYKNTDVEEMQAFWTFASEKMKAKLPFSEEEAAVILQTTKLALSQGVKRKERIPPTDLPLHIRVGTVVTACSNIVEKIEKAESIDLPEDCSYDDLKKILDNKNSGDMSVAASSINNPTIDKGE